MVEKTVTMSYNDYQMMSLENEEYKQRYEILAQEKMVYLTLAERNTNGYLRSPNVHRMSGTMVEKDELLSRMQIHLDGVKKRSVELELEYKKRIQELEEQLRLLSAVQAPIKAVTKWWHKLLK
jgi:hypothetical protein